jgi:hypothetical protein
MLFRGLAFASASMCAPLPSEPERVPYDFKSAMNRPPTLCLFCGQAGNMSKQHVFPDRLRHVLPRQHGKRQMGSGDNIRRRGRDVRSNQKVKESFGSIGSSRLRKVCKSCNNGWLNTMEQECFPAVERLIRRETSLLLPDEQIKLATIATSIAMTGEWLHQDHVATSHSEREAFRQALKPPPGWYIFIGRNGIDFDDPAFFSEGLKVSDKPNIEGIKHYTAFTMVMGPVLLHVMTLASHFIFDVDGYAQKLGLASIYPTTDWIQFEAMPLIDAAAIRRIRNYARMAFRQFEAR